MTKQRKSQYDRISEGLLIIKKYDDSPGGSVSASHDDMILAGGYKVPGLISDEDKQALEALDWFHSKEFDCFAIFV